jgi:hypothetical protein
LQNWICFYLQDVTFDNEILEKLNANVLQKRKFGRNSAVFGDSTCCIVKPHLVSAGMAGAAIYEIQKAGFEISAIMSVSFAFVCLVQKILFSYLNVSLSLCRLISPNPTPKSS